MSSIHIFITSNNGDAHGELEGNIITVSIN